MHALLAPGELIISYLTSLTNTSPTSSWGGCIVAMCESVKAAADYVNVLKREYYSQLPAHLLERYQPNDFNEVVFATFPSNGAELFVQ